VTREDQEGYRISSFEGVRAAMGIAAARLALR
jgi:hypothetical protein